MLLRKIPKDGGLCQIATWPNAVIKDAYSHKEDNMEVEGIEKMVLRCMNRQRKEDGPGSCEVTLRVCEAKYYAHKVVLEAHSEYFRERFLTEDTQLRRGNDKKRHVDCNDGSDGRNPQKSESVGKPSASTHTVVLHGIRPKELDPILEFMYTSELSLCAENVNEILFVGNLLQMSKVIERCADVLLKQPSWRSPLVTSEINKYAKLKPKDDYGRTGRPYTSSNSTTAVTWAGFGVKTYPNNLRYGSTSYSREARGGHDQAVGRTSTTAKKIKERQGVVSAHPASLTNKQSFRSSHFSFQNTKAIDESSVPIRKRRAVVNWSHDTSQSSDRDREYKRRRSNSHGALHSVSSVGQNSGQGNSGEKIDFARLNRIILENSTRDPVRGPSTPGKSSHEAEMLTTGGAHFNLPHPRCVSNRKLTPHLPVTAEFLGHGGLVNPVPDKHCGNRVTKVDNQRRGTKAFNQNQANAHKWNPSVSDSHERLASGLPGVTYTYSPDGKLICISPQAEPSIPQLSDISASARAEHVQMLRLPLSFIPRNYTLGFPQINSFGSRVGRADTGPVFHYQFQDPGKISDRRESLGDTENSSSLGYHLNRYAGSLMAVYAAPTAQDFKPVSHSTFLPRSPDDAKMPARTSSFGEAPSVPAHLAGRILKPAVSREGTDAVAVSGDEKKQEKGIAYKSSFQYICPSSLASGSTYPEKIHSENVSTNIDSGIKNVDSRLKSGRSDENSAEFSSPDIYGTDSPLNLQLKTGSRAQKTTAKLQAVVGGISKKNIAPHAYTEYHKRKRKFLPAAPRPEKEEISPPMLQRYPNKSLKENSKVRVKKAQYSSEDDIIARDCHQSEVSDPESDDSGRPSSV